MLMKEMVEKKNGGTSAKKCIENAHWKETEAPMGCKPTERASQEIPDKRILQEEKAESMSQLSVCLGWAFEEPKRQKILLCLASGR